eukprot:comp6456_c0_seq1/m.2242 comp6456_c0_seq1/g.2242  ORF comp6456_c0_seq1/g.2242 comp6456_c0_seq1/m.2242 type:complete len:232 (-) comp6456_c0_seq1:38-733(-)
MAPPGSKPQGKGPRPGGPKRPNGGVGISLAKLASSKVNTYVPVKKELERKTKRSFVNKFRKIKRQQQNASDEERPSFYDKIFSGEAEEEVSLLPRTKSTAAGPGQQQEDEEHGPVQSAPRPTDRKPQQKKERMLGYGKREHSDGEGSGREAKKKKADPYAKQRRAYEQMKAEREAAQKARELEIQQKQQLRKESQLRRKDNSRKMMQRTKKGQPIMANQMDRLLAKLQNSS